MSTQPAHSFLGTAPNLQTLLQQAQKLQALQKVWDEIAPRPLAAASTVGAMHLQTLIVYASNGAVAAKLRQLVPSLLEKTRKRGFEVTAIRIDVQVEPLFPVIRRARHPTLNVCALNSLSQLEQNLDASPLKSALQKLIRRHSDSVKD